MTDTVSIERVHQAIPASGDVAIGHLAVLRPVRYAERSQGEPADELALLRRGIAGAAAGLAALTEREDALAGDILAFQIALLEDDDLIAPILARIEAGAMAHEAWARALDGEIAEYRAGGDDVLAARADDLIDLKLRVLAGMSGAGDGDAPSSNGAILVAEDLTPSKFLEQDWSRLAGAAVKGGSPTSHVAILARARNVNMVVGLAADLAALRSGAPAVLDARRGRLIEMPSAATLDCARTRMAAASAEAQAGDAIVNAPAVTAQGAPVRVLINVDQPALLDVLDPAMCDGIGLTRTEFLYESGRCPSEDEQLALYARLIAWADGRPVTVRTLDAGGDKPIAGVTVDGEANPFLGIRGVRLSLRRPDLLDVQLRALARAAALGPLKVMVPMVSVAEELQAVRAALLRVVADLAREGVAHVQPPLGMMVEVPAAALTAEAFDADFYSIGSNDLIQYTLAMARDNPQLAALCDPLNPAVLELIGRVVEAARRRGVEVSLCGDMASSPHCIAALLDLGLSTLSVAPAQVGRVKLEIGRAGARE